MDEYGGEAGADAGGGAAAEDKVFPNRHKVSIGISAATTVSLLICVIGYGAKFGVELSPNFVELLTFESACAIQSVFGIFTSMMLLQLIAFVVSWIGVCCGTKKDFYRLNVTIHSATAIGLLTGCIIFGIKKKEDIQWFFFFAIIGAFLCGVNLAIWFPSQYMRRREKLQKGKMDAAGAGGAGAY